MVDIKREDITLQDWTKGISADEFAWGSYFFADGIQTWYTTKWFKLWYYPSKWVLNYRSNWNAVSMYPSNVGYGMAYFTKDWMIETTEWYNSSLEWTWWTQWGWAYYAKWTNVSANMVNWLMYGTKAFCIYPWAIRVADLDGLFSTTELLSNPDLTDSTGWTLGTWWTTTDEGAEHSTGTAPLTSDFTLDSASDLRIAVKIIGRTKGDVSIQSSASSLPAYTTNSNGWATVFTEWAAWSNTLTITPSSTFDWTLVVANVQKANHNKFAVDSISITSAQHHPCVIWAWDLYVGSGSSLDIISLADYWVTTKNIIDVNETIVDITQQAWNLIIWATDGYNSRQYYWNWVDAVASEIIEWKWLIIKWVVGTETISYVLTTSWTSTWSVDRYQYRLYAVSGYQRSLLANKDYDRAVKYNNYYNKNKKYEFNDVDNSKSMCMYRDSLYLPWCDWVYKYGSDIPWLQSSWSRPLVYDAGATNLLLGEDRAYLTLWFTLDGVNYHVEVDDSRYNRKWYLVTEWIYWDKLGTRKAIDKLKIWYKNVASEDWNIKIYAIVDDDYFWRFWVSGVSTRPSVWDVYTVANQTTAEVISLDKTNWIITFRTVNNLGSYANSANTTLTRVSGSWDVSITVVWFDNMVWIKTIESEKQWYGSDLIFWKDFVNNYMPYWHKIQLVVELNSSDSKLSPEIYEIWMQSDITDVIL